MGDGLIETAMPSGSLFGLISVHIPLSEAGSEAGRTAF